MPSTLNPTFAQILESSRQQQKAQRSIYLGRVTHIITGPNYEGTTSRDPLYNDPTDIGKICFQMIDTIQDRSSQGVGNPVAKPLMSDLKKLPLLSEIVAIVTGPSIDTVDQKGLQEYYYLSTYNVWNSSHQNAIPDPGDLSEFANSQDRNYEQSAAVNQAVNLNDPATVAYPLTPSFLEKSNIKTLRPFTGDVTIEGRWGNSIRFGSTTAVPTENPWSSQPPIGNPITIIRNGQGRQLDDTAWIPTVEDINRDPSNIYLTQGQKIVIDDIQNNFSLATLGVALTSNYSAAIPIQEQLADYDSISPSEQDKRLIG
jgi:hypothetical protein